MTTLVLGTLRWQMKLDAYVRALLARPGVRLPAPVESALRLGAYQILYLDRIPDYAAIGESVELVKQAGETHAARMVNAVLRKLAGLPRESEQRAPTAGQIAVAFAHPVWMVERWSQFYGLEGARAICHFDQEPAPVTVRLLDPDVERDLAGEGILLRPGEFLTAARRVVEGDVARSKAFQQGRVRIQDEGSQLIAELAGEGRKILDTCAAPGGKAAILAERNPEAAMIAWDISRRRLEAMQKLPQFASDQIRFEARDAGEAVLQPEFDLILCDVPCSGTGTIGRNPEIRFRVSEEGLARHHARQVRILSSALQGLVPGGRLLYSTCSLEAEENEAVVTECLNVSPGFVACSLAEDIRSLVAKKVLTMDGAEELTRSAVHDGFLRTLPGIHHCDGFFAASIIRI